MPESGPRYAGPNRAPAAVLAGRCLKIRGWSSIALSMALTLCLTISTARAEPAPDAAQDLRASYETLRPELANNQYKRPLHLESRDNANVLQGTIYAVLDYSFAKVDAALSDPSSWCDVFTLHFNIKFCRVALLPEPVKLSVYLGKKSDQALADSFGLVFWFKRAPTSPTYFSLDLTAAVGPLGTRDSRLELVAIPLDGDRTFLRLHYAYSFGMGGRLAMHGYLATIAREKLGFTVTGRNAAGGPLYIQGLRGVMERNTMRYYLAVDAYLASLSVALPERFETRLGYWFDSTEQYTAQLHEMNRDQYLELKRREMERQTTMP